MSRAEPVTALPTRQGSTCYEKLRSSKPLARRERCAPQRPNPKRPSPSAVRLTSRCRSAHHDASDPPHHLARIAAARAPLLGEFPVPLSRF